MPLVSINILTKNRAELLRRALLSVAAQSFPDYEVVIVNDGSTDPTAELLKNFPPKADPPLAEKFKNLKIIAHPVSLGIIKSRQEALEKSVGEYVAVLDDDDEWIDFDKLKKQVEFLDAHPDYVLVGGGIKVIFNFLSFTKASEDRKFSILKTRPETDAQIRRTMLFRNNFFTSTVMFRREAAVKAGGFIKDADDLAEDYDLWLRLGKLGKMYNFPEVFTAYRAPGYNKERFQAFFRKQLRLIGRHKTNYPHYWPAALILKARLFL
jgi:glycosyltransferase involved in cell wall biosynthesis